MCVWVSECEREKYVVLQTLWIRCTAHTIWRQNVFGMTPSFMPNKLTSHDSYMKESCHTVGSCSHEPQIDTASHCNATHCNTMQHTATHCNTLQRTATLHLRLIQPRATNHELNDQIAANSHTAKHCKTLQHTATHCNTLQHTATLHLRWIQPRTTNWIIKLPRLYEPLEGAPEQVMSHVWIIHVTHVNEWCHTCEWVLSHMWFGDVAQGNKSCHTYGSHKCRRRSWRMSHVTCEWVMSRVNESCHMWMSHVTCEWVMSHVNESCRMWMSHVTCERVMSRVNESCHMRRSHVKCE